MYPIESAFPIVCELEEHAHFLPTHTHIIYMDLYICRLIYIYRYVYLSFINSNISYVDVRVWGMCVLECPAPPTHLIITVYLQKGFLTIYCSNNNIQLNSTTSDNIWYILLLYPLFRTNLSSTWLILNSHQMMAWGIHFLKKRESSCSISNLKNTRRIWPSVWK